MCGIAGFINCEVDEEAVKRTLYHRGPDEQSSYKKENVTLVHTRLAIQDVVHGQQPYHYENYTIVFNGEVYNHKELRKHLADVTFQTHSDTETLLHLYIRYKTEMFGWLDGMFALAIVDWNKKSVLLARDRAGKKPLYIYKKGSTFAFASEMSTLHSVLSLVVNEDAISTYLRFGATPLKDSVYRGVEKFPAGCWAEVSLHSLERKTEHYFCMRDFYLQQQKQNVESSLLRLDEALHKSVKDRLESSDLEVGAFLSGGIDSSLIVAVASEYCKKLKTFTVSFEGGYDESPLAELTAKKYNTEHTTLPISMNLKHDVEHILQNYAEPFSDSSAIPSYYVSQEAKKYVTVVLNGDGADELFGGYRRYVPMANNWIALAKNFSFLQNVLPHPHNKKSVYSYFYRLLAMSNKKGMAFYLSATSDIFEDAYTFKEPQAFEKLERYITTVLNDSHLSELSKILLLDYSLLLFGDLLVKMDIATMRHSLEGRSPFLSKYMLEFAPTLPDSMKINGKTTKFLLRKLAENYLPEELIHQPKRGFEIPLKRWVESELQENIYTALRQNSYSQSYIDQKFISDLLARKVVVSDEKRAKMLWSMYALEVWYNKVYKR